MDNETIMKLKEKNKQLSDILIKKIKREYIDDIDLIGVCGSFYTGDFYEKSDLDLVVVLNNDRGWGFSKCFILEDVGYDFYGSTWDKLSNMASFDNPMVSHVIDVDIVYSRAPECLERFKELREKALNVINNPTTPELLNKVRKYLEDAIFSYGEMMLEDDLGRVRTLSGDIIQNLNNTVCFLNHSYFKLGVKRHLEEVLAMSRVPKDYKENFLEVIFAETTYEIKEKTLILIKSVRQLYDEIALEILEKPVPTKDNLRGTYEEVWSNWRNKVQYAMDNNDVLLAFSSGVSCQEFYDDMHKDRGTSSIDLMKNFNANELETFRDTFYGAMEEYKKEYDKIGLKVAHYDTINEFKSEYIQYIG